jgi:hypothetical protein
MGDEEYARWERGNIRGLGSKRRFVGTDRDPETGQQVNIYEFTDDEFSGTQPTFEQQDPDILGTERFRHLEFHRTVYDPGCRYCRESR